MKLVILDRDGVINQDRDDFVKNSLEWVALPRSLEAIALLSQAGWHVVVATNQSGLGRGLFDMHALNAMHEKMHRLAHKAGGRIDAVFFCPHKPDSQCACRKPLPGMVLDIAERFGVRPESLPLDLTLEAHIPADKSSIAYRRGLKKMGFGEFFLV